MQGTRRKCVTGSQTAKGIVCHGFADSERYPGLADKRTNNNNSESTDKARKEYAV